MNIPTLKWIKVKEFGCIPIHAKVINGTVTQQAGKYYASIVCEVEEVKNYKPKTELIGIDLGIKDFAIVSNGIVKKNINKTSRVKKLERKLKREQVRLSRKYESLKKTNKTRKGEATRQNILKQIAKVQRIYQTLHNHVIVSVYQWLVGNLRPWSVIQMRVVYCLQSQNQTHRIGNNLDMGIIVYILSSSVYNGA